MVSQNVRTISTEGLAIEHYLSILRGEELLFMGQILEYMEGLGRRLQVSTELHRRFGRQIRPRLQDVKRRAM